jgi:hypothetical protein
VLEEYAEFLSPLRLPRKLRLIASDCSGSENDSAHYSHYVNQRWMNLCYLFMNLIVTISEGVAVNQEKLNLPTPVSAEQLRAGMFASVLLHETGHALFDLLSVPVFGREEDAADQMAALVALQFGKETARTAVKGFAYLWKISAMAGGDPGKNFQAYADSHGTASQRMYNTLCLAYGAQPGWFQDFVDSKWLPEDRAKGCKREYDLAFSAFKRTVLPFIDPAQMEKVRARQWFEPAELKEK